jgi:hypothetical protein
MKICKKRRNIEGTKERRYKGRARKGKGEKGEKIRTWEEEKRKRERIRE